MEHKTSALIVAKPTRMRDGLRTLLRAIPQIETVVQADDGPAAIKAVMDYSPTFILLDLDLLGNQLEAVIKQARDNSPRTYCIALADTIRQQEIAWANGADEVLLAGFPAAKLFTSIHNRLAVQEPVTLSQNGPAKRSATQTDE